MSTVTYQVVVTAPSNQLTVTSKLRPSVAVASTKGVQGIRGKSNYEVALDNGFVGTESEWLESLKGDDAYLVAVENGFAGTVEEWLESLQGLSAYEVALNNGFVGTESEWLESLRLKATPADFGKILSNDGENTTWESLNDKLNSSEILWDLGEI